MSALATISNAILSQYPTRELKIETGDLGVRDEAQMPSQMPLVLWQVRSSSTRLRATSPVTVRVRSEGNWVFVENETLRIFAHGQTLEEALEQFGDHVVHFYQSYANLGNDQVIGEGARLKDLFGASFVRV